MYQRTVNLAGQGLIDFATALRNVDAIAWRINMTEEDEIAMGSELNILRMEASRMVAFMDEAAIKLFASTLVIKPDECFVATPSRTRAALLRQPPGEAHRAQTLWIEA